MLSIFKRRWNIVYSALPFVMGLLISSGALSADREAAVPPLNLEGQWSQGGIIFGKTDPAYQVQVNGERLRLSEQGHFVFGIDRDAPPELQIQLSKNGKPADVRSFKVAQREYKVQRIEGVQQKHVTPPESVLSRIRSEAAKVREARSLDDDRRDFLVDFIWPLHGPITGVYGSQRVYNGVPKTPHYGLDIAAPTGTVVVAPAPGLVTLAEPDLYYSGGTVILDHGFGLSSTFIHLNEVLVEVGQKVKQGEAIAKVGATGRATGPHLDWRMNWFNVRVDPQLLMEGKPMKATQN